jgi:hypothetical protein
MVCGAGSPDGGGLAVGGATGGITVAWVAHAETKSAHAITRFLIATEHQHGACLAL